MHTKELFFKMLESTHAVRLLKNRIPRGITSTWSVQGNSAAVIVFGGKIVTVDFTIPTAVGMCFLNDGRFIIDSLYQLEFCHLAMLFPSDFI